MASTVPTRRDTSAQAQLIPMALVTWAFIGLILLLVVALVVVKLTEGSPSPVVTTPAAPASVVAAVAQIPSSAFDAAGVGAISGPGPMVLSGQPALEAGGLPEVVFVGADFSPYSAAESWVVVIALSRFGAFSHLSEASSSVSQVFGAAPEFTFAGARYRSSFVSLTALDAYGATANTRGAPGFPVLAHPGPSLVTLLRRYGGAQGGDSALPFLDVANRLVAAGGMIGFSPGFLQATSIEQVATDLADPASARGRALLGAANLLSAAICAADGGRPALVCQGPAVMAATARLSEG